MCGIAGIAARGVGQPVSLRHAHRPAAPGTGRGRHRHLRERPPSLAQEQRHGARRLPRRPHARPAGGGRDRPRALPDRGRGGLFGGAALLRQLAPRHRACPQREPGQCGRASDGSGADRPPPPEHGLRLRGAAQRVRARAARLRLPVHRRGGHLPGRLGSAPPLRGRIRGRRPRVRVRAGRIPGPRGIRPLALGSREGTGTGGSTWWRRRASP